VRIVFGSMKAHVLVDGAQLRDLAGTTLAEEVDELGDELLRRAGAGGMPMVSTP